MLAAHAAHQREVGDVGDGDDENEGGGAHEQPERQTRPFAEDFVKWDDCDLVMRCRIVRVLVLALEPRVHRRNLGPRLLQRRAGSEARDDRRHPMRASLNHLRAQVVLAHHHVEQGIDRPRIERRGLQHADDRRQLVVEAQLLADDARIAVEAPHPVLVREHRHAGNTRSVVARSRQAADHRRESHDLEVVAGDEADADADRPFVALVNDAPRRILGDAAQRWHAVPEVADLRNRKVEVALSRSIGRLPQIDQPIAIAVGQRLEQDAPHDAKDRRVGSDA